MVTTFNILAPVFGVVLPTIFAKSKNVSSLNPGPSAEDEEAKNEKIF